MNKEQLQEILEKHDKWLTGEGGERADLRHADLQGADLRGANLRSADLQGANLWDADLRNTNLWGADLWDANDAPLLLQVGPWPVYIHSGYMRIGCKRHSVDEWRSFSDDEISEMDESALEFWRANREWLLAACDAQMATIYEEE